MFGLVGVLFLSNQLYVHGNTVITTILGTDTLSASRTTINNNFSSLNTNKVEISDLAATTSLQNLATVGTITTGVWQGTAIGVAYNGTGTTSPTSNQIMIGNGASGLKVIGFGSSGQFFTSGGAGVAPSWTTASIDQTQAYTWTGLHTFNTAGIIVNASSTITATTTIAASSVTNKALVLNAIPYAFPSTQSASGTVLTTNGSGSLSWNYATSTYQSGTMVATSTSGGATSGNEDKTQTIGFSPQFVRLNYYVQGHTNSGGSNVYTGLKGTAIFLGTTLVYNNILWNDTAGLTGGDNGNPIVGDFSNSNAAVDTSTALASGTGNNSGWITSTLSIVNVTSTAFTIRCAFSGNGGNTGRCAASWEAWR